ncbi:hypothetical protein [Jeotgalibacillus campisalis]|uniref:YhjD n=1 Tax=Jeotgalibacillus campisalis TaxID=220754 RepID=A0A0C2RZW1_9BACL|nr:hypothetical protein [Jeotgalibacillus campisalis]KIL47359.1 hypothetical protein KR50_15260 [Jeotgalibacillus campisalis]
MTRIPAEDRDLLENAFYFPMLLTVLERDRQLIEQNPFKLKKPYLELIEDTMKAVQVDLTAIKNKMRMKNMKVVKLGSDEAFTSYLFIYRGYEERHNYFNPRLRNHAENLLRFYLLERLASTKEELKAPPSAGITFPS